MDANGTSKHWYRNVPLGKVKRRVQDLRIPSSSSFNLWSSRPPLDLSHNEGARLAVDVLLSQGLKGYHTALQSEGEVDFLSEQEKNYFLNNGKESLTDSEPAVDADDGNDMELESLTFSSHSATPCPSVSKDSDTTETGLSSNEDEIGSLESSEPNVEAYFFTDKKAAGLKDVVREFIRKAEKSLAIVTDSFSDVELLCDLLEASKKRFVSVYLLLDHLNLNIFRDMWQEHKLQGKDFPKFSVHSVEGQTFQTKTGRKLNGQISEHFIIADWTEALTGSFSFSWLSWLVHRNLAFLIKGSAVTHFLQEFQRLSSCSTPVPGFIYVSFPLPIKGRPQTNTDQSKGKIAAKQTDVDHIWDWIEDGKKSHTIEQIQTSIHPSQFPRPLRQPVMQHMCMEKFKKPTLGGIPVQNKDVLYMLHAPRKSHFQNNLAPYGHSQQNSVNQDTKGKNAGTAYSNSSFLTQRQDKTVASTQSKDVNDQHHHNLNSEDYWNQRQNRAIMTPPGIAAGINKLREERNNFRVKPNPTHNSKVMHCFMPQEKNEKHCVTFPMNGTHGVTNGLQTTVHSNEIKTLNRSPRHHFLQSHTGSQSQTTSILAQPILELNFSPAKGHKTSFEKVPQQVNPCLRQAWITRPRPMTRPVSFYSYDTVQKLDGQRQNTSTKTLARSKSMTERPETCHKFK